MNQFEIIEIFGNELQYYNFDPLTSTQTLLVQHTDHTFSASWIREFNTKNPSVRHTSQFNTPLSSTHPSIKHPLNLRMCWTEECVELKGFWFLTHGFWMLKRCGPCVELRGSVRKCGLGWAEGWVEVRSVLNWRVFGVELTVFEGWEEVSLLCWTEGVWNWGGALQSVFDLGYLKNRQSTSFALYYEP